MPSVSLSPDSFKHYVLKPRKVLAKRARCPSFPGALAALFNFDAGIFLPALIPNAPRNAPGF